MPQKRQNKTISGKVQDELTPKKRRVTLACDACRAAREKCDGIKPQCSACVSFNRPCSYTPATKKRGVQSGYLRTIELSLAWVLGQMPDTEESLHNILTQPVTTPEARALLGRGSRGRHLQEFWNRARIRSDIETLISNAPAANVDSTDDESNTEPNQETPLRESIQLQLHQPQPQHSITSNTETNREPDNSSISLHHQIRTAFKLPAHWKRLLDAYKADTHCWLPILLPNALYDLAATYGTHGLLLDLSADRSILSPHSELWAALAVASFQNPTYMDTNTSTDSTAAAIFNTARSLLPDEDNDLYDLASVRSMMLHSLIFIGRGKASVASLLLGKAFRILCHLQASNTSNQHDVRRQENNDETIHFAISRIACSFLDKFTLLSLSRQSTGIAEDGNATRKSHEMLSQMSGFCQHQSTDFEFVSNISSTELITTKRDKEPIRTLLQLHTFTTVLACGLTNEQMPHREVGPDELVRTLDPHFIFCNSLIPGSLNNMSVSSVLVKSVFLTASIALAPHLRPSLFPGFLENIQYSLKTFGANRSPLVVPLLFSMLQHQIGGDGAGDPERRNAQLLVAKILDTWNDTRTGNTKEQSARPSTSYQTPEQSQNLAGGQPLTSGQPLHITGTDNSSTIDENQLDSTPDYPISVAHSNQQYSNDFFAKHSRRSIEGGRQSFSDNRQETQPFDFDALFDDLGSIDYMYNTGIDTQFMTNLGFAPDCDLSEIFQSDYGL